MSKQKRERRGPGRGEREEERVKGAAEWVKANTFVWFLKKRFASKCNSNECMNARTRVHEYLPLSIPFPPPPNCNIYNLIFTYPPPLSFYLSPALSLSFLIPLTQPNTNHPHLPNCQSQTHWRWPGVAQLQCPYWECWQRHAVLNSSEWMSEWMAGGVKEERICVYTYDSDDKVDGSACKSKSDSPPKCLGRVSACSFWLPRFQRLRDSACSLSFPLSLCCTCFLSLPFFIPLSLSLSPFLSVDPSFTCKSPVQVEEGQKESERKWELETEREKKHARERASGQASKSESESKREDTRERERQSERARKREREWTCERERDRAKDGERARESTHERAQERQSLRARVRESKRERERERERKRNRKSERERKRNIKSEREREEREEERER